jgi:hypothetical protein
MELSGQNSLENLNKDIDDLKRLVTLASRDNSKTLLEKEI